MKEGKTDSEEGKTIEASVFTSLQEKLTKAVALDIELEHKEMLAREEEYKKKKAERQKEIEAKRKVLKQSGKETFLSKAQWGLVKAGEAFVRKNNIRKANGELMLYERDWKDQRKALSQWMFTLEKHGFTKNNEKSNHDISDGKK